MGGMNLKIRKKRRQQQSSLILLFLFLVFAIVMIRVGGAEAFPDPPIRTIQEAILPGLYGGAAAIAIFLLVRSIKAILKRRAARMRYRYSGIGMIDKMTGTQFEEYLSVYFRDLGYTVHSHSGGKGDKGADRILTAPDGKRICVQAKCWNKNVTFEAVQQVHTAKSLYNCDSAWIITNRYFTKQVKETAAQLGIELWDRQKLMSHMHVYRKQKAQKTP